MNSHRKHLKLVLLILIVSVINLSCSVTFYKSGNSSFYEAVKSESKTKIIKKDGKREKFSKVVLLENGEFYGINWINRNKTTDSIFIDTKKVKKVKLENKKLNSTIYDVSYLMSWIGGLILAIVYVYPWMFGI